MTTHGTKPGLWSAIPLGTVAQRTRVPAPTVAPTVTPRGAPPAVVEDGPTTRLSARLLAARAAAVPTPAPPTRLGPPAPTPGGWPAPQAPGPDASPQASVGRSPLPWCAMTALLAVAVAVLVPWPGAEPWVALSPVGLALLAGVALLTAPVTVDLVAGRARATAMLLGLPLMAAAAAGTVVVSGGDLPGVLAAQGLDARRSAAAVAVAVALAVCLLVGALGAVHRPGGTRAAGVAAVVVGLCAAVSVAAASAIVLVVAAPAPPSATVAAATGAPPTATTGAGSSISASGTGSATATGTACPSEAASTFPETAAGALVVAHDARVHLAICQGASGALYYYGADDRTHLTITLPATRSGDSWIATNKGVTYSVTAESLTITKGASTLADEPLTTGWTR